VPDRISFEIREWVRDCGLEDKSPLPSFDGVEGEDGKTATSLVLFNCRYEHRRLILHDTLRN
jgi:hypothetical protein